MTGTTAGSSAPAGDVPERIVSLSPTHTEMLFAIGAGDQVIAVDDQSNYPPEAEAVMTDLSGFKPNVEAIAGYEPDLVVTSGDDELTAQLEDLGIAVWVGEAAATFDEAYAQIEQLGAIDRPRRRGGRARRPDAGRHRGDRPVDADDRRCR